METIERFLKDNMDSQERKSFEAQMKVDAMLSQQVEDTRVIFSGIKKAVLQEKLNHLHEDLVQEKQTLKSNQKVFKLNFKTLSIAATILILIGSAWFFNQQPTNQKLFNEYFKPDRGLATLMGKSDNYAFDDAMVDYKNAKYDLAIEKWQVLLKTQPENDTLNYFIGVAFLAHQNENKAIAYLNAVTNDETSEFILDAHYYLGLANLKLDKTEAALENFKENNSPQSKKIILELTN